MRSEKQNLRLIVKEDSNHGNKHQSNPISVRVVLKDREPERNSRISEIKCDRVYQALAAVVLSL